MSISHIAGYAIALDDYSSIPLDNDRGVEKSVCILCSTLLVLTMLSSRIARVTLVAQEVTLGADVPNNGLAFRSIKLAGEEKGQVEVGDVIFVASDLTCLHNDGSVTRIQSANGVVQIKHGSIEVQTKRITTPLEDGVLGRDTSVSILGDLILKAPFSR